MSFDQHEANIRLTFNGLTRNSYICIFLKVVPIMPLLIYLNQETELLKRYLGKCPKLYFNKPLA